LLKPQEPAVTSGCDCRIVSHNGYLSQPEHDIAPLLIEERQPLEASDCNLDRDAVHVNDQP
jgi:hypothetical protein